MPTRSNTFEFVYFALLFARLENERFNGKVLAQAAPRLATLYFAEGRLLHAATATLVGEDAIYDLMSWGQGVFTLEAESEPAPTQPSLDEHQLALLRETFQLFQSRGIFAREWSPVAEVVPVQPTPAQLETKPIKTEPVVVAPVKTEPVVAIPTSPVANPDPLLQMIAQPVSWVNLQLKVEPLTPVPPGKPGGQPELKLNQLTTLAAPELEQPISFNLTVPLAPAPAKGRPISPAPVKSTVSPALPAETASQPNFTCWLPPGKLTEPGVRLEKIRLIELVGRVTGQWPNAYIVVSLGQTETGLLLIEQGRVSAVRYATPDGTLKAQTAYDALEKAVNQRPSQVSIYHSESKLLQSYRALVGGDYLFQNVQASTLDVVGLMGDHARRRSSVALRAFNGEQVVFYFLYQGEALGSFQLNNDRLERGGDVRALLGDPCTRLDLLEAGPAEIITLGLSQMLQPNQISLLVEAANCVLQVLATLAGPSRVLAATRRVLENSAALFPCLQRLGVDERPDRLALNWTLDQTQAFVSRAEAQNAFNFLLTALFNHHDTLLDPHTLRELARRAIFNQHLDLEKENLTLDCLPHN